MTLVCAPVKVWPEKLVVDLYEFAEEGIKKIYDKNRHLKFILVDWLDEKIDYGCPIIVGYHDYEKSEDPELILAMLKKKWPEALYYKIATFATTSTDAFLMLAFQKKHPEAIGICMGEKGAITRILAPVVSAPIAYAPLSEEDKNAPGQIAWQQLDCIYHFKQLNPQTTIYALIGNPIRHSIGHLFHNAEFRRKKQNCVYIKIPLEAHELPHFFALTQEISIHGVSVTAPLKEKVLPYLQTASSVVKKAKSANTLVRKKGKWHGENYDGKAVVDGLKKIHSQKIVVLGAGGAARSIIYELMQNNCNVFVWNKTASKAIALAKELGCQWEEKCTDYNVVINTTPISIFYLQIPCIKQAVFVDINISQHFFIQKARHYRHQAVCGFSMYFRQAFEQQAIF